MSETSVIIRQPESNSSERCKKKKYIREIRREERERGDSCAVTGSIVT
jgi:hypothetical protein